MERLSSSDVVSWLAGRAGRGVGQVRPLQPPAARDRALRRARGGLQLIRGGRHDAPTSGGPTLAASAGRRVRGGATTDRRRVRDGETAVHASVLTLREAAARRAAADAELLDAVRGTVEEVRQRVLAHRDLLGVQLSKTQERAVAAEIRSLAAAEVELAAGFGVTEARTLVRAATAPKNLAVVVDEALERGEVSWPLVRVFYESSAGLDDTQRLLVGVALMGSDAGLAAADRLDPDGQLHGAPWGHQSFTAALAAEVTACRSTDAAAERAARARAYAARRVTVRVHDDGTATLRITGPATGVVAAGQRLDRAARVLRRAGDERTLDQLRSDLARAALIYGTIDAPVGAHGSPNDTPPAPATHIGAGGDGDRDDDGDRGGGLTPDPAGEPSDSGNQDVPSGLFDELVAPDDMDQLARVLNGQPPVELQVVVPFSALSGGFPLCARCCQRTDGEWPPGSDHPARPPDLDPPPAPAEDSSPAPADNSSPAPAQDSSPAPAESPAPLSRELPAPVQDGPTGADRCRTRGRVGQVLGPHPFFITDGHARELALFPGTTLHRLVVDPVDGRLVERTITAYRPDTDMRRQVIAADVLSRAPGPRLGSHAGELDHVTPYGWAGGPTSELNLVLLARRPHRFKTEGTWRLELGARRDLAVTTLLGQVARTRMHDYRTYLRTTGGADLDLRRDRANRLVYAALAEHPATRYRRVDPRTCVSLTRTDPSTGEQVPGVNPQHPSLVDLLGLERPTES